MTARRTAHGGGRTPGSGGVDGDPTSGASARSGDPTWGASARSGDPTWGVSARFGDPNAGASARFGDAVRTAERRLAALSETARLDAEVLLAHAAGVPRSATVAFPERELEAAAGACFDALVARREAGEPVAYLTGEKPFHAIDLRVDPAVLVPRPETEHLVDEALDRLANVPAPVVLDLGTGSGALALAIKRARPDATVIGADVSPDALAVARANGARLGLDVAWRLADWFAGLGAVEADAILCNPPYLASADPHFATGLRFEPRLALDGGADGLDAIRRVLAGARPHLRPGGVLLIEHGHDQRDALARLAIASGFERVKAGRDLAGLDRYAVLRLDPGGS